LKTVGSLAGLLAVFLAGFSTLSDPPTSFSFFTLRLVGWLIVELKGNARFLPI
jgi:hypothetical protein